MPEDDESVIPRRVVRIDLDIIGLDVLRFDTESLHRSDDCLDAPIVLRLRSGERSVSRLDTHHEVHERRRHADLG